MAEPILFNLVNSLYHVVMDHAPKILQERPMASAFTLGFLGTYSSVRGFQWVSKHGLDKIIPHFDKYWLPNVERAFIPVMTLAPLIYAIIDPDGAKGIMTQHPVYISGMAGVYLGSLTGMMQDLHYKQTTRMQKAKPNFE